jgi:membrane protein
MDQQMNVNKPTGGSDADSRIGKDVSYIKRMVRKVMGWWRYASVGVWSDTRQSMGVNLLKTVNLSVRSFLNGDLQSQSCAMTYRTLLALVPALALLFAIGRGFGFQSLMQGQLFRIFPAQHDVIEQALGFVDKYLSTASEGLFVGIGLVVLLWTIISLISNIEDIFNNIWGVRQGRSIWRKITDYTAMMLILPVLMVCASGLQILMTNTLQTFLHFQFLSPLVSVIVEIGSCALTWMFFTAVYMLIPNTRVKFKNACVAGVISGTGFLLLQWLFVSGQMYVARYNAIYGSFSFLPLLLVWCQLAWLVTISGAVLCYSSQSIFQFSFDNDIHNISEDYREKITLAIAAVVTQCYVRKMPPPTVLSIVTDYEIPIRLVTQITDRLVEAHVLSQVIIDKEAEIIGFQPAQPTGGLTVSYVRSALGSIGSSGFVPRFHMRFKGVESVVDQINRSVIASVHDLKLEDIQLDLIDASGHKAIQNRPSQESN